MMMRLVAREEIRCDVCKELLWKHKFNANAMSDTMNSMLDGTFQQTMFPSGGEKREAKMVESDDEDVDTRTMGLTFLRTLEPMFTLLPKGMFGKKYPLKCTICRTRTFPDGKILEMTSLREKTCRHFVTQHMKCATHQQRAKQQIAEFQTPKVKCQALCVNDPENGSKLYTYKNEFALWAQHSNFVEMAKHPYFHDAGGDGWFVRAASCLQETEERPNRQFQTCSACLVLGGSHGVAWHG